MKNFIPFYLMQKSPYYSKSSIEILLQILRMQYQTGDETPV